MNERLDVCTTLTAESSKFLIQPMLVAIETVVHKVNAVTHALVPPGKRCDPRTCYTRENCDPRTCYTRYMSVPANGA